MDVATLFASDYATARARFRQAALDCGCQVEAHAIDRSGPNGEDLAIDVAIARGANSERALLVSSGMHGVEGFFGSAVQLAVLRQWAGKKRASLPVRCLFLHALNPFGFAWLRRVNEENVDLNRNLLPEGEPFRGSPHRYRELDRLLNPKRTPSRWEPVTLKFLLALARHGMPALKEAVASGQYDFPRGLFFGGARPSRSSEILAANFERWLAGSRLVAHLDLHTGLGAWAGCKLLIDHPLSEAQRRRLERWFGPDSFECSDSHRLAYPTRGSFGQWCAARSRGRDYLYAAAEFGTHNPARV
ncbi:MAG: DUF2817 domain-containing protein, partial [Betaproteobacteria bacterium]|nr:DUF2817 domain-containing protein [Betaproteobacteria bacterium]